MKLDMFFGVADMMGHPWEHLIEHYQKKTRPKAFPHVRDYAGFTHLFLYGAIAAFVIGIVVLFIIA